MTPSKVSIGMGKHFCVLQGPAWVSPGLQNAIHKGENQFFSNFSQTNAVLNMASCMLLEHECGHLPAKLHKIPSSHSIIMTPEKKKKKNQILNGREKIWPLDAKNPPESGDSWFSTNFSQRAVASDMTLCMVVGHDSGHPPAKLHQNPSSRLTIMGLEK